MGLQITKENIIEGLGPRLTSAFNLSTLPAHQDLNQRWEAIELPNTQIVSLHASTTSIHLAKSTDLASIPSFLATVDTFHPEFARLSLYSENENGTPMYPFKSNASEFFVRSIQYLCMVSPHGLITGLQANWKVGERNYNEFFSVYSPTRNNLVQAALQTYTGQLASRKLHFTQVSMIPGYEGRIPHKDNELSLIFKK